MHITLPTEQLKQILEVAARISTRHLTLPILQCVLLEAEGTTLTVKATNLEVGVEGTIPLKEPAQGKVAVPAQVFLSTVQLILDAQVTLSVTETALCVETKSSKTNIKTLPTEEFPHIPRLTKGKQSLKGEIFTLGVEATAFAASQSSIKPELGSIFVTQRKAHTLTFVSTDSFRLVEKTIPTQGFTLTDSLLIPYKNALELSKVATMTDGVVDFYIDENQCAIAAGPIYITSRLINGTFPDYEQIIPKEYVAHTTVLTQDFARTLKKTNVFLNKFMQLTLALQERSMLLSSQSSEVGTTEESLTAATEGSLLTLSFNQRYFSEIIPHIIDDSLVLHFAGIGRPVVIENAHDRTLRYLVMPMNK